MVDSERRAPSLFRLCAKQLAWQHLEKFETFLKTLTYAEHKKEVAKMMIRLLELSSMVVRPRRKFYLDNNRCFDQGLQTVVEAIPSRYLTFRKLPQTEEEIRKGSEVAFTITQTCRRRILGDIKKLQKIVEKCDVSQNRPRPSSMSRSAVVANRRNFFDILPPFS